jgi:hypothetical protein
MKNHRVKHAGDRDRILAFMEDEGLVYDLARPEDSRDGALRSLIFFRGLQAALQEKGILFPETGPIGCEPDDWNQVDFILDTAAELYAASRATGFRDGVERGYAALTIGAYYQTYPERLLIAKYIRKHHAANPQDICEYVDNQEGKRVASMPPKPGIQRLRPYPLPWESKPLGQRTPLPMQALERRMRWGDALDKKKNTLNQVRYLRSFLSKQKDKALRDKDAQMYFAWRRAAAKGMVIENDRNDGPRQVTCGDSWRHLQSIGTDIISPQLEKALREREQRRASDRSYRRTLGDLADL